MKHDDYRDAAALPFYSSGAWKECRKAYAEYRSHLCERCLSRGQIKRGEIVHHVIPLTADNITDPEITLSWNNLQLLCRRCHGEVHAGRRFMVDDAGHVTAADRVYPPIRE